MDVDDYMHEILSQLRLDTDDNLSGLYYTFEDLYERKLWHQLTESLQEFYLDQNSKGMRLRLFKDFIMKFYKNLNQLKFVHFLLVSVDEIDDNLQKLQYLKQIQELLKKQLPKDEDSKGSFGLSLHEAYNQADDTVEAYIYLEIAIARLNLYLGEFETSEKTLAESWKQIEGFQRANNKINAAYYSTSAEYYKLKHDYNNYYRNSLLYLSSLDSIEEQEKTKVAYDLSIAALLGDDIYNFGELLLHEILDALKLEYGWLRDLLFYLNQGDLKKFHEISIPEINAKSELLKKNIHFLKQKICLMSLTESIIAKPNGKRIVTFAEISANTLTLTNEIEFLVMRALSLGLIKGFIDQINQTVSVSWVQPRIMNQQQIQAMSEKLVNWSNNVDLLSGYVQAHGTWSDDV